MGSSKNKINLKLLFQKFDLQIKRLQETNFKDNYTASLNIYHEYSKNKTTSIKASEGTKTYVKSFITSTEITIHSYIEHSNNN